MTYHLCYMNNIHTSQLVFSGDSYTVCIWLGARIIETNKARKHKNCISSTNRVEIFQMSFTYGGKAGNTTLDINTQLLYCSVSSYICI